MSWTQMVRRVLVEKRVMLGIVGAVLLVDVGLYTFAVYPLTRRVQTVRARALVAAQRLKAGQDALSTARTTMEGKTRADAELEEFYGVMLPQDLADARTSTYPRLSTLARRSNLVLERRSSTAVEDEDVELGRLRTTMLLAGEYRDIRQFLYELERSPEFVVIDEVVLSQGVGVESALVLALGVSTYYRVGDSA